MIRILTAIVFSFSSLLVMAQAPPFTGKVEGVVVDTLTQQPVEYAAVSLLLAKDSTVAGGMVTDEKGMFSINVNKPGMYFLRIKFIGYTEKVLNNVLIKPDAPVINFGKIFVHPPSQTLGEVEIVHQTEVMEANLDKKVINVEKDLTSTGGTALDLMKNVPSVQVDVENNVSLRGNANVRILIDGRLSTLDPSTLLQQIPASMVKQIEVITNPSARYDPDGVSGIINIITKKERKKGFNGIVSAGAGTGSTQPGGGIENFTINKYNYTTSLNYQVGKWNFFGSYDGRYGKRWNQGRNNTEIPGDTLVILDQNNGRMRGSWNHNAKLGFDLTFNDKNMLTLGGSLRREKAESFEVFDYRSGLKGGDFIYHYDRVTRQNGTESGNEVFSTFKHSFKGTGHQLVVDAYYSKNDDTRPNRVHENHYNMAGEMIVPDSIYDEIDEVREREQITAQVDYVYPTEKYGRFETGVKYVGRNLSQSISTSTQTTGGQLVTDTNRTNRFDYIEDLYSAYFIYGNSIKKFQYQGGIRFEQAFTESYQVTLDQRYVRNFYNFFPSAHLKYTLKNEAEMGLSYSRRINRPGNYQLNPYPDYSDKLNQRRGNPYLKPEYTSSFEFSYGKFTRQVSYSGTLFYRTTVNSFYRVRLLDPVTGVSVVTHDNISASHAAGLELTYNQPWTKWLRVNGNLSGFYFMLEANEKYNTPQVDNYSWTSRVNFNFSLSKTFDAQLGVNYRGPMAAPQGVVRPMGGVDIGLKKDFWNKKASLAFKVSDIFNTQRFSIDLVDRFVTTARHKWESRTANLTFTWRINQGTERRDKPRGEQGGGDTGM